jgi:Lrp/AsnC family leucine-responsive transcriptional regulator
MVDTLDSKNNWNLKINSRTSFVEIGKQIGLSPSSVRERVQKLEDTEVIKGYTIQLKQKLGFGLEVFIMFKLFSGKLKFFCDDLDQFQKLMKSIELLEHIIFYESSFNWSTASATIHR